MASNTTIDMPESKQAPYGSISKNEDQTKEENACIYFISWIFWFLFGGGMIMTIIWCLIALVATLLLIPAKSSICLFKVLPVVISPAKVYADCKTIQPSCFDKLARLFWILPFGLVLSIIHFCLGLVYLPLLCCKISWSKYHFHAMAVCFNPFDKIIIDTRKEKYTWYSRSYEVVADVQGLENKVVIVTGCNTGLGKETAKILYSKGCIVVMACRNPEKANNARNDIIQEFGDKNEANLIFIRLDLGDLKTIDEFVAEYQQNEIINGKLDTLICNAGVMAFPDFGVTKDGFERQFGINHMGHFYLFNKLLPIIKANKTRIVCLSSIGHYLFHSAKDMTDWLNIDDNGYKGPTEDGVVYDKAGFRYYGISKLSNLLFARQINKLYNKDGIYALALHPGGIMETELGRNGNLDCGAVMDTLGLRAVWESLKIKDIPRGSATTLRCATITNEEILNGGYNDEQLLYFDDCMPRNDKIHGEFINNTNTEIDELLWNYSCKAVEALDYLTLNEE